MARIKNILLVHNGALGDFLCAWPGIYSIVRHYQAQNKPVKFWFSGRDFGLKWLEPFEIKKAPPEVLADLDEMYLSDNIPAWLEETRVFWFCLERAISKLSHPNLSSLPILDFSGLKKNQLREYPLVIDNLAKQLTDQGIEWCDNWQDIWQDMFGVWQGEASRQIGLIPGSGHTAKSWPLHKFEALAKALDAAGFDPVYLLGPVEREREMLPLKARVEYPSPAPELADRMMKMRAIIACDGGPAHLASHHGVPGLVLFGPIKWQTWAPEGLKVLLPSPEKMADYPAPVNDPKNIYLEKAGCMDLIELDEVLKFFLQELSLQENS